MEETLISFDTAKLAKEKGFSYKFNAVYWDDGELEEGIVGYNRVVSKTEQERYGAPTKSLLQKWLRDIHGIHIIIIPTVTSSWTYKTVTVISQRNEDVIKGIKNVSDLPPYKEVCGYDFNNFEDALEDALFESLKLI